ncbi:hypothetical protein BJ875DRAFT_380331 [Amylocarpus encephaloides]|uniref:C2H2-type domain-containing protein n=1 Tax=Amylocarpus encephaloides TaxID=45428 RepID=A0A9P7YGF3_9HELO|nr:hypothetical protein BJ875DRAFT_380331 [Amylocarpus encephaloides]
MPVSRSPYVSNTTSKALAQPPKGPEKSSETLWSTPQYSWVKVATWGPGKSAFEVNTAFTERLEISLEEPIKPADISWGPGKSALEVNGVATQRLKNALFDESTDNSWGAGFDDNPWGSGSAKDSWASRVKVNKPDAIANFSFDPSESSFRAEAYWLEGLGKYKCPHKGCKKSFEKKMSFLTHLKSVVHMGVQERLQCRKCLDWFGSATALAQHAESQGLCILRDSDQYTRCVDEFTAGYAAPAGRHYDTSVRYVVNPVEKGNADPKTITARITEGQKALAAEKQKMDEKYWEVHQPKW